MELFGKKFHADGNLEDIFTLVEAMPKKVIIKVKPVDNLTIAMYPYINSNYDYITVDKGASKILTVIRKDGSTFSFNWGEGGYTLISKELENLKKAVVEYIEDYCHILLDWIDERKKEAHIYFNKNYGLWQLTIEGTGRNRGYWWSDTAQSFEEMAVEVIPYVKARGWEHYIATTGIDCWKAIF
jgi:hypothetical protein